MKKNFFYQVLLCAGFASILSSKIVAQDYLNTALPVDKRVDALIASMTLTEKVAQLGTTAPAIPRLGVLAYQYWNEALHGISRVSNFTTLFPQIVGLSASWDRNLIYKVATAISDEARVEYKNGFAQGLTYFSPTINMARDPRWGRTQETYGEDPYLTGQLAMQFIKGMQGNDPHYYKTTTTVKHFVLNNIETNRFSIASPVDQRSLREYYLPAFKTCITNGKAYSVMSAYDAPNGIPSSANRMLLTNILRKEWGFDGYVVSDCDADYGVWYEHKYVDSAADATALCIRNGNELNCGDTYQNFAGEAISDGLMSEADIDTALKRVFKARFLLGEFDPSASVPYASLPDSLLTCTANQSLAVTAAHESMVLLKNDGLLPLDKNNVHSLAVIGPNADQLQLGDYSGTPKISVTPLAGIEALYGIDYSRGKIEASHWSSQSGVQVEGSSEGETDVCFIDNGDYTVYNNVDFGTGKSKFDIRVSSPYAGGGGPVQLYLDGLNGTLIGSYNVPMTGDWQNWTTVSANINISGVHDVYLKYGGGMNIEWLWFYNPVDTLVHYDQAVRYAKGCSISGAKVQADFDSAVALATHADVAIVVCGADETVASESNDRSSIELPGVQEQLIQAVYAANPNTIVVLVTGCPMAIPWTQQHVPAIVDAGYGGQAQGTAIADVLFGNYNPAGKLTTTWFNATSDLPSMADYNVQNGRTYMYYTGTPLYPFGYGLSYTTFGYSNLRVSGTLKQNDSVMVLADITNTGSVAGDEVAQLYIHNGVSPLPMPAKALKGFQRISLQPGQTQTVGFLLKYEDLAYYDTTWRIYKVDGGIYNIMIGASSADIRLNGTVSAIAGTASQTYRQDPLSIMEAENFESKSLTQGTVKIEHCGEGGQSLGYMTNGSYVEYGNMNFGTGVAKFNARIAQDPGAGTGATIEVRLDGVNGTLAGVLPVAATTGWQNYTTQSCTVTNANGVHDLYLVFKSPQAFVCNMNYFSFGNACPNNSISYVGTAATGNTYQWQVSTDSGAHYADINNGALYSGVISDTLTLSSPPTSMYGYRYRCAITNAGVTTYSGENILKFTATWTGAVDTDWANNGNWSCNVVPDANTDVIINTGSANYPVINSSAVCRSITANENASVQVNTNYSLQVTGKD